ncbi:MAG TPA: hypothetical protein PK771_11705 [Spirochaetota bacterium]|nr:hypothetical protein [Spirochaetota bacterium]
MGISRLKRLLIDDISRTFDTRELQIFVRSVESNLDLYELTGFPQNCAIPRKDAAKSVVEYFFNTKKTLKFLNLVIYTYKNGFKGEKVVFNGINAVIKEMAECGYQYNKDLQKVIMVENTQEKRNDWGFLEENKIYNFCFASVDICGNSKLVRKYESSKIKDTYNNFKKLVCSIVEYRGGRIWSWEGDGGLFVFHIDDFVKDTILASIEIMSSMILFNATANFIGEDITIRIGINAGPAEYKSDTSLIISDAIELTKKVEKKHTKPKTISITKHTAVHIDASIRNYFNNTEIEGMDLYQIIIPMWRKNGVS